MMNMVPGGGAPAQPRIPGSAGGQTGSGVGLPSFSRQPAGMPDVGSLPRGRDDLPSMGMSIPSAMGDATPAMAQLSHLNNPSNFNLPMGENMGSPQRLGDLRIGDISGMASPNITGPKFGDMLASNARIRPKKPKFFSKDGMAPVILAAIADAFAPNGNGHALQGLMERRDSLAEKVAKEKAAMAPRAEQVGNTLGMFDPTALSFNPIYSAPQPFEAYARARGFEPGTPEYHDAVEDYRLGAWSDPAMEAKQTLEGVRYGYRDELQDDRLTTSRRNTDVRASVTRRGQNMTDSRARNGQTMTDARVRGSAGYNGRGGKGAADLIGPVYTKDGKRIQFSKSRNSYVSVP